MRPHGGHACVISAGKGVNLPNGATVSLDFWKGHGSGFRNGKMHRVRCSHKKDFWPTETTSYWEKLLGSVFFSIFGQTRCRKSTTRGFWTF
jgi:hypothetical protein